SPLVSTAAAVGLVAVQVKAPTWLVISLAFGAHGPDESCGVATAEQACGVNCWVCFIEVHPATGSTNTAETAKCSATVSGVLFTPPAVAVIVALPFSGLPAESVPLHTMNEESHTPPQTRPEGDTVTRAVFEEVKVKVAATGALAELSADAEI